MHGTSEYLAEVMKINWKYSDLEFKSRGSFYCLWHDGWCWKSYRNIEVFKIMLAAGLVEAQAWRRWSGGATGGGRQSTSFSCLTRRNHQTIFSPISYCSQPVPQTRNQLVFLLEPTLLLSKPAILSASEAADVWLRPTPSNQRLSGDNLQDTSPTPSDNSHTPAIPR